MGDGDGVEMSGNGNGNGNGDGDAYRFDEAITHRYSSARRNSREFQ